MNRILDILQALGIPFAYDHFAEGESPEPPFICYLLPASDNFAADGQVYFKATEVHIELYTDIKDVGLEASVEAVLDEHGIFYDKSEVWIESERLYEVLYSFEMEVRVMGNKVKYNLKNVHAAKLTETVSEGVTTYTYATPQAIPGAVSISLDAEGDSSPFYADGIVYFRSTANNGYSGDLEIALIPEWFRTEILKETLDSHGVLVERSDITETAKFALLFEFDGDVRCIRHVLYNCSASRPSIESETKEDTIEPGTETLSLTADPRSDGLVKSRTGDNTEDATYQNWYSAVYVPEEANLDTENLSIGDVSILPDPNKGETA